MNLISRRHGVFHTEVSHSEVSVRVMWWQQVQLPLAPAADADDTGAIPRLLVKEDLGGLLEQG